MERIKNNSMELEDEIDLHKKGWIIQRIGWLIMLLFVLASLMGLFGTGWLSNQKISKGSTLITFEKFGRFESSMKLEIFTSSTSGDLEIKIPRDYLTNIELDKIVPIPKSQIADQQYIIFHFDARGDVLMSFHLMPKKSGKVSANLKVNGSDFLISHFIYP
jgi:hypothetical protein